ncbi:hypothetical protein B0O99DRAFT_512891 [Bisporella sp. PMI_857]|nr:hypothetical protein B0O99DRAFT_512891 [Bisporella sp. PMI_857]
MNSMTVIPGFVSFREAYIIKGKTIEPMIKAVELFNTIYQEASIFEHPDFYTDDSIFLVIELANAGVILDSIQIFNPAMVWDVLIAVIIILARGEAQNEFEHRDLHENNICIAQNPSMIKVHEDPGVKFGQSGRGLYVTLIDYGLSRARLGEGDIAFSDLEDAMFLFRGPPGKSQFNAYRIMRHHLLTGKRTHQTASWHDKHSDESKSWSEFIPYTNVVWIHYLLGVLRDKYQKDGADSENFVEEKRQLNKELRELESRLGTKANGFQNAMETLEYIFEQGWITQEQYENYGIEQ